jgi:hypothetical protein
MNPSTTTSCVFHREWLYYTLSDKRSGNIITLVDSQSDKPLSASAVLASIAENKPANRHVTRQGKCQGISDLSAHPLSGVTLDMLRRPRK